LEAFGSIASRLCGRLAYCFEPEDGIARGWRRWPDSSPTQKAAARHEPKPYASPPPKSLRGADDFAIVLCQYGDIGPDGQAQGKRAKARGQRAQVDFGTPARAMSCPDTA